MLVNQSKQEIRNHMSSITMWSHRGDITDSWWHYRLLVTMQIAGDIMESQWPRCNQPHHNLHLFMNATDNNHYDIFQKSIELILL